MQFSSTCTIKKREKHGWRSITFYSLQLYILKHSSMGDFFFFFRFFLHFTNGTKSCNAPHADGHFIVTTTNFRNGKNIKILVIVNYNKSKKM